MRPERKEESGQTHLALRAAGLWEKLPEDKRSECSQWLRQLLEAVVFNPPQERRSHERED